MPRMRSAPAVGGETQPIMRMVEDLPAPLGPRKPNASPGAHLDVDPVDGGEVTESLDQATGVNEGFVGHAGDPTRPADMPAAGISRVEAAATSASRSASALSLADQLGGRCDDLRGRRRRCPSS